MLHTRMKQAEIKKKKVEEEKRKKTFLQFNRKNKGFLTGFLQFVQEFLLCIFFTLFLLNSFDPFFSVVLQIFPLVQQRNMEQLEALKITMETVSRKDVKEKLENLRLQTMLLKEEKRKDLSSEFEETKETKKRRLLQELKDLDEDAEVMVISDTLTKKDKEAKEIKEITANQIKIRCFQDLLKSTGTSPKSSFEARAGFVKSLMLAGFSLEERIA
jgi:hypothetical protein